MTKDKPNHVYFSNRANALLESKDFDRCIMDCDVAIAIEAGYAKSYFRKSKALIKQDKLKEALECINKGIEIEPMNMDFKFLSVQITLE